MNDKQIQDIADRVIAALENLAPVDPGFQLANLGPIAVFIAACVAAVVGYKNLTHQQEALKTSNEKADTALKQKREADARSEWWRRTQWALEATVPEDNPLYDHGAAILNDLAKSDLTGAEDKKLLDTVWKSSATEMQDKEITDLLDEIMELQDLDADERETLSSFVIRFQPSRFAAGNIPLVGDGPGVDDAGKSEDNGSDKEGKR